MSQKKGGGPGSPAHIEYKGTNFLIINQPSATTMSVFIDVSKAVNWWCVKIKGYSMKAERVGDGLVSMYLFVHYMVCCLK